MKQTGGAKSSEYYYLEQTELRQACQWDKWNQVLMKISPKSRKYWQN